MSHGNARMTPLNMVDVRCPVYRRLLGDVAGQWAEPDLHALGSAMHELHDDPSARTSLADRGKAEA